MGGYWDPQRGRYVTADEADVRQRPFDRNRRDRRAAAVELIGMSEPHPGFAALADGDRSPVKGAARAMLEMIEHGADPKAISARLAEDRELLDTNELDEPGIGAELVAALADEADERVGEVRREREHAEIEDAFDEWLELTYDVDELRRAVAQMHEDEAQEAIAAVAERFTDETGLDSGGLTELEDEIGPEFEPYSFDDDAGEPGADVIA